MKAVETWMLGYPCHMPRNPYIIFSSFFQQLPLISHTSLSRFTDSLSFALHQGIVVSLCSPLLCVLWFACSVHFSKFMSQIGRWTCYIQPLSFPWDYISIWTTRGNTILKVKSQISNSGSKVANLNVGKLNFTIVSFVSFTVCFFSLSSGQSLLEAGAITSLSL